MPALVEAARGQLGQRHADAVGHRSGAGAQP
jgi:hypothetical protein